LRENLDRTVLPELPIPGLVVKHWYRWHEEKISLKARPCVLVRESEGAIEIPLSVARGDTGTFGNATLTRSGRKTNIHAGALQPT
jgi:hypothetical protein